jgi:hypothetical protein
MDVSYKNKMWGMEYNIVISYWNVEWVDIYIYIKSGLIPGYTRSLGLWSDSADHPSLTGSIAPSGLCDLRSNQGPRSSGLWVNLVGQAKLGFITMPIAQSL